ncbi:hypothetical protein TRIP_B310030 [uncultured Desulfatiglans sp.]|nr:hypothetical protein TRIP_B310030 [uncultured Desulfatiglans sp.]
MRVPVLRWDAWFADREGDNKREGDL